MRIVSHHHYMLSVRRKSRLDIETRRAKSTQDFTLTIKHRQLPELRRRYRNHDAVAIAADTRGPGRDRSGFRQPEQKFRLTEFEVRRNGDRNRHDSSIESQIIQFPSIAAPKCHALAAFLGDLPWSFGWGSIRRRCWVEWAHVDFISSGLIRHVGHETDVGRKARALYLGLAAKDFDRFPFSRPVKG